MHFLVRVDSLVAPLNRYWATLHCFCRSWIIAPQDYARIEVLKKHILSIEIIDAKLVFAERTKGDDPEINMTLTNFIECLKLKFMLEQIRRSFHASTSGRSLSRLIESTASSKGGNRRD